MSRLNVNLLGRINCQLPGGERLNLSTRKAEALLAYLALASGLDHSRDRLVNLLWSDRGEDQARNSLRQALSSLKKLLDAALPDSLVVDRTTVRLNSDKIVVDVDEFKRLADESEIEKLTEAADYYRGEFLEGMVIRDPAGEQWLVDERENLKRIYADVLGRLGRLQLDNSDFKSVIVSAERLVSTDPLEESGWRLLMTANHRNGNRNHALMAYRRCCDVLQKELAVEPELETKNLQEQIKQGRIPLNDVQSKRHDSVATYNSTEQSTNQHSILVLPFKNMSDDSGQQYFSDGLTDSIITGLSLFPGLKIHSRHASFAADEQGLSIDVIGERFSVTYIVTGSVRKSSDQIRVSAQLINTQSGEQVWGNQFDNILEETLALEDRLTRSIVAAIRGKIESTDSEVAIHKPAQDIQSYDLLLQGYYHLLKYNPVDSEKSEEILLRCLEIDPENPIVHNRLYQNYIVNWLGGWSAPRQDVIHKAGQHISNALALSPDDPLIQAHFAEYSMFVEDWGKAEAHADRSLILNPNDSEVLATVSAVYAGMGQVEKAIKLADTCHEIDPFHPWIPWVAGVAYYRGKQYREALKRFNNMPIPADEINGWKAACYYRLGDRSEATKHLRLYLDICKTNMAEFPKSLGEWRQYWIASASYRPIADEEIDYPFDALCEAGLVDLVEAGDDHAEQPHSIAVLPFDNLSGDPEQEYFSDGISESIIINLSLFPGLLVKSRNSSFAFKEQIKSLGEISKELNVDYVVEGSVRKASERIRITVQLIEAGTGNQIWGKRYDDAIDNLFDLEEALSRTIAATVTGQIESDIQRIAISKSASGQKSYDLLLSGKYHCYKFTRCDMLIALKNLEACLELDPSNVQAHALLYECHIMNWVERWVVEYEQAFKSAGYYIHKALELDPDVVMVQIYYAEYLIFCKEYEAAARYVDKVLSTNPNNVDALTTKAFNYNAIGEYKLALETSKYGQQLDPYNPWVDWIVAEAQLYSGDSRAAVTTLLNSNTSVSYLRALLVFAYAQVGEKNRAKQAMHEFLQSCRDSMLSMPVGKEEWARYWSGTMPYKDTAMVDDLLTCLMDFGLCGSSADDQNSLPSILVLPFENLSGDPEQDYFSDGITESIILALSRSKGLKVKSRHTSFAYKNSSLSLGAIGEALDIQYIVEGSVRKYGDQIRVTVQLGEINSGNQIWGNRYDSPLEQIFELEEDLVHTIVGTISGRISRDIKILSAGKPPRNLKSFDYLARGNYHLEKFTREEVVVAKDIFQKCLEIDPANSAAHTSLAIATFAELFEGWAVDRQASKESTHLHILAALEIEPDNALTHAYLSEYQLFTRDFELGIYHADRSIELGPHIPDGYAIKAYLLAITGKHQQALELADISMRIDPYHYYMGWNAGEAYRICGRYQKALETFRSIPSPSPSLHAEMAACLVGLGQLHRARAEMSIYLGLAQENMNKFPVSVEGWHRYWYENVPYQQDDEFELFFGQLLEAGLCDMMPSN